MQHAPGQDWALHVVFAPEKVPVPHAAAVMMEHVPAAAQHAPVGCGQRLGEQLVPLPR